MTTYEIHAVVNVPADEAPRLHERFLAFCIGSGIDMESVKVTIEATEAKGMRNDTINV